MEWRWEARKKHWDDWREIAMTLGMTDEQHRLRRWDGPAFWGQFSPRGHDAADFDSCKCGRGLPEQTIGYA